MRKKFVKFNNHSEYSDYIESTALTRPNVALCAFEDENHFYPKWHNPPQDYVLFKDPVVWKECCTNWGDYYEENITEVITPTNNGSTIETTSVKKIISMLNSTKVIEHTIGTFVTTEESTETAETTTTETRVVKTPIGITMKQIQSITTLGNAFNRGVDSSIPFIKSFNELEWFTGLTTTANAFRYQQQLESVILPPNTTTLGSNAFNWCDKLSNLVINEGCTTIGGYALWECRGLKVINIPSTVTSVGTLVIQITGHYYGYDVILKPTTPPSYGGSTAYTDRLNNIYVPDESLNAYKTHTQWSVFVDKFKPKSELPDELKQYWP